MDRDTVIALADKTGLFDYLDLEGDSVGQLILQNFAALVAAHKEKEMQERIDALFAMYEQACQQRDQLMDMQRAQIAAMRGRTQ